MIPVKQLRDIAVSAFASESLANETWSELVNHCCAFIKGGGELSALIIALATCESDMKREYDVTAMPPAWRSAKSVVLSALAEEIELIDGSIVRGKTAVEKDVKAKRASRRDPLDDEEIALAYAQSARENLRSLIGQPALKNTVVQEVLTECVTILKTLRS